MAPACVIPIRLERAPGVALAYRRIFSVEISSRLVLSPCRCLDTQRE
nr:MAG TPA: hypothetical protein [Caudoviricetes sp.]